MYKVTSEGQHAKTILRGTVQGKIGRQRRRWEDNFTEWTGKALNDNMRRTEDTER